MGLARTTAIVPLPPDRALALWSDVRRWPTFVEGFRHALEVSADWPAAGAHVVWQSVEGGRGRVTERVVEHVDRGDSAGAVSPRLVTRVFEDALTGTQTVSFAPVESSEAARVELSLDYELTPTGFARRGPLGKVADALFIRRALRDAAQRGLRRFGVEAEEEAAL